MSRKQISVSSTGPTAAEPSTVIIDRLDGEIVARIAVADDAALEFADRLAERGAIPSLERLLADALAAYVAAPDRLIRDLQRGGRPRTKKPSRPAAKPAPARTTTATPNPTPSTSILPTNNPAPEPPTAPHNTTPYILTAPEPPNPRTHTTTTTPTPTPTAPSLKTTRPTTTPTPTPTKTPGTPDNRRPPNSPSPDISSPAVGNGRG